MGCILSCIVDCFSCCFKDEFEDFNRSRQYYSCSLHPSPRREHVRNVRSSRSTGSVSSVDSQRVDDLLSEITTLQVEQNAGQTHCDKPCPTATIIGKKWLFFACSHLSSVPETENRKKCPQCDADVVGTSKICRPTYREPEQKTP